MANTKSSHDLNMRQVLISALLYHNSPEYKSSHNSGIVMANYGMQLLSLSETVSELLNSGEAACGVRIAKYYGCEEADKRMATFMRQLYSELTNLASAKLIAHANINLQHVEGGSSYIINISYQMLESTKLKSLSMHYS